MLSYIQTLNHFLWGFPMLFLLFGTHIFFTVKLKFIQRKVGKGIVLSFSPNSTKDSVLSSEELESTHSHSGTHAHNNAHKAASSLSAYSALMTMLAATIGTGNIIGISTAVAYGGPGAVLWCWLTGLLGMGTSYAECYLCHHFRRILADGTQTGGPMYVLYYAIKHKATAFIYAIGIILASFLIGAGTQANSITLAAESTFHIKPEISALICCALVGLVLICGAKAIGKCCSFLVPVMGIFYIGSCLVILYLNRMQIMPALLLIIESAFGKKAMIGGLTGGGLIAAMRYGIARGLYTNEAGIGSAGITSACADTKSSQRQALISMTGVFWDTVVMCGITGLVIVSNIIRFPESLKGIGAGELTTAAFSILPAGEMLLSISLILFAISTIIGWSFFGEQGLLFFFHRKIPSRCERTKQLRTSTFQKVLPYYKSIYLIMIFAGGILPMDTIWEMTDFINLFLFLMNIYALFKLHSIIRVSSFSNDHF